MGYSKGNAKREIYSNTSLAQETRETSNKLTNPKLKVINKRRIKSPQN